MPTIQNLLCELKNAGVTIAGEDAIQSAATSAGDSWPQVFSELAVTGRKDGVLLTTQAGTGPTMERLDHILSGYPFTFEQCQIVMQNIIPQSMVV